MTSRRSFITKVGIGLLAPQQLLAVQERKKRSLFDFLSSQHEIAPAPVHPDPKTWDNSKITAAWIGHATVLINFFGTWIITDPVFSAKAGIKFFGMVTVGTKRLVEPALRIEELPPIDLILLSHAHMDHLDLPSLRQFDRSIPIVTAKNTSDVFNRFGERTVHELDWGERMSILGLDLEGLKVKHFGWRFPWEDDRSRGAWNGRSFNAYLISKNGKNIVFGGDTANQDYFKVLAERGIPIDLAIMPIGAYDPWIHVHASPEQSVAMANQMNAKTILPIHWGTFMLGFEPQNEPIERLKKALEQHSPSLALERIGETWKMS